MTTKQQANDARVVAQELVEALEACVASLVDAGRDHAPSVQQARIILAKTRGETDTGALETLRLLREKGCTSE